MSKRKTTTIAVSVHLATENPMFGESATHVVLDDEAGGAFIILRQFCLGGKEGEVRFDLDELEVIVVAARGLIDGFPKEYLS